MSNDLSRDASPHRCPECDASVPSPNLVPAGSTIFVTQGVPVDDLEFGWTVNGVQHFGPIDVHQSDDAASLGLPAGLTFCWCAIAADNNNYFRFRGTPSLGGSQTITRPSGTVVATILPAPQPTPTITNTPPNGRKGIFYTHTVTIGPSNGTPILHPVITITNLSLGLTASGGTISGIPDSHGTVSYVATISCLGNAGVTVQQSFNVLRAAPIFSNGVFAVCTVGQSFSFAITCPDSATSSLPKTPNGITAGNLPNGLTIGQTDANGTAIVSGVPTGGWLTFAELCPPALASTVFSANSDAGDVFSGETNFQLVQFQIVNPNPPAIASVTVGAGMATVPPVTGVTISSPTDPKIYANETALSYQVVATRCPVTFSATGLPTGLSISTSGRITGTATTPGIYPVTVSAINAYGTGSGVVTIIISFRAPVFTNPDGTPCTQVVDWVVGTIGLADQLTATNSPQNWSAVGLPAGLGINPTTGLISGTPTVVSHNTPVVVTVDNIGLYGSTPADPRVSTTMTFNIVATAAEITPAITSNLNPLMPSPNDVASGIRGVLLIPYQITATHCPNLFNATSLPPGLSVNTSTGLITGTPTQVGFFATTVFATNTWGTGSAIVNFIISYPAPVVSSPLYTFGETGSIFDPPVLYGGGLPAGYHMTATIADPSDTIDSYHAVDALPDGLTIDNLTGIISGTVTGVAGIYNVGIFATNVGAHNIPPLVPALPAPISTLRIAIFNAPPVVTSIDPDVVVSGTPTSVTITGSGFLTGAKVFFGNVTFVQGTNVVVVNSTTLTVTVPSLALQDDLYDVVVQNLDGQAGIGTDFLFVIPPGTTVAHQAHYTSLYSTLTPIYNIARTGGRSNRKKRIFGLGTNVEVLFYSGLDVANKKILNVYRKQNGTTSTRHGAGDLVFKGIAAIQVSPYMYRTNGGDIAHLDCLLRSNGRVDMHLRKISGIALIEDSNLLYASYEAVLIKTLSQIPRPKIGTDECS